MIATGKQHLVRDFINEAAKNLEEVRSYNGKKIKKIEPNK